MGGRAQGGNGGQREIVYKQPGTEVDIPITTGGCQVSRKKGLARGIHGKGNVCMYIYVGTVLVYVCQNDRSDE